MSIRCDFFQKPRHVIFLEEIQKDWNRSKLHRPTSKSFSSEENFELWKYCLGRGLVKEEAVSVPGIDSPWETATKFSITSEGTRLLMAYQILTPKSRSRYSR